jgi:hypothetical protein
MKTFTVVAAAVTLGLLAEPAAAQMGGKRNHATEDSKSDPAKDAKRSAEQERAYKAALERIPDSKEKYDPWGGVVPADSGKKPK